MPDDTQESPASERSEMDDKIQNLADEVERRLAEFAASDNARRKLVALLNREARTTASERLSLRARKFTEQAGRCAHCFHPFGAGRRPAPMVDAVPLLCAPCDRGRRIGRSPPAVKKT